MPDERYATVFPTRLLFSLLALVLAATPSRAINVPDGFVLQPLNATGGQIAMPKGWFYYERVKGGEVIWTLSKEDSRLGPYLTGVKIQFFAAVKEPSGGKTAEEFCRAYLEDKKKTTKVVTIFPEKAEGMFTRYGVEDTEDITENGITRNYHVLYTAYWTNDKDMAVMMVAGAPAELWSQYAKAFDVMSDFELLDMSKLPN